MSRKKGLVKTGRGGFGMLIFALTLALGMSGCGNSETRRLLKEMEQAMEDARKQSSESSQKQSESNTSDMEEKQPESEPSGTEEKQPEAGKTPAEMSVREKLQYLTIEGIPMPIPYQVGELDDKFTLGKGVIWGKSWDYGANLLYNGVAIGMIDIIMPKKVEGSWLAGRIDMSHGYEEGSIIGMDLSKSKGITFELLGVTFSSTKEDVIAQWGEPKADGKSSLLYQDDNSETQIIIYLDKDGIVECIFLYEESLVLRRESNE